MNAELESKVMNDPKLRRAISRKNLYWFYRLYFPHYVTYKIADFQKEMIYLLQDEKIRQLVITAFRGSAKSTICSLIYPLWCVVGERQKKYVLLVCQTQQLASQMLANIKAEIDCPCLMTKDFDFGFEQIKSEWNADTIVLPGYDARISVISIGESIRGLRHKQYRPDLIILDDVEDVSSAKTKEGRDKLWQFVSSELIPTGDSQTQIVCVGNLVHLDSMMMRLKQIIDDAKSDLYVYREYPLVKDCLILWPDKYPTLKSIEELRASVPSHNDYEREYMLKISPEESRIINFEDLHFYDEVGMNDKDPRFIIISVDTAISEATGSDKTAILAAKVFGYGAGMKVCIEPHLINKVMSLPKAIQEMKDLIASYGNSTLQIVIEGGPQKALIQMLAAEGINVKEFSVQGNDKRTRLNMVSPWVKNGKVIFPRKGCEELIDQLVYFGTTKHDDLADSFSMMIMSLFNQTVEYAPIIGFIEHDRPNHWRQINSLSDLWEFGR